MYRYIHTYVHTYIHTYIHTKLGRLIVLETRSETRRGAAPAIGRVALTWKNCEVPQITSGMDSGMITMTLEESCSGKAESECGGVCNLVDGWLFETHAGDADQVSMRGLC